MSQCCDQSTLGVFGSNWIWIIILILICCGGFGNEGLAGIGNILGAGNCTWIWILIALYCCCCSDRGRRC